MPFYFSLDEILSLRQFIFASTYQETDLVCASKFAKWISIRTFIVCCNRVSNYSQFSCARTQHQFAWCIYLWPFYQHRSNHLIILIRPKPRFVYGHHYNWNRIIPEICCVPIVKWAEHAFYTMKLYTFRSMLNSFSPYTCANIIMLHFISWFSTLVGREWEKLDNILRASEFSMRYNEAISRDDSHFNLLVFCCCCCSNQSIVLCVCEHHSLNWFDFHRTGFGSNNCSNWSFWSWFLICSNWKRQNLLLFRTTNLYYFVINLRIQFKCLILIPLFSFQSTD